MGGGVRGRERETHTCSLCLLEESVKALGTDFRAFPCARAEIAMQERKWESILPSNNLA